MSKRKEKKSLKQVKVKDYVEKENHKPCDSNSTQSSSEMKEYISKLSLEILSRSSDQCKKLKELFRILEDEIHGKSIILRKSVIVSLCLVFKDILPSYKITILTDEQRDQSMKKETVKMFSEEELLLGSYQRYVKLIESVLLKKYNIEAFKFIKWTDTDHITILKCACELFLSRPHFNYSNTLLSLIIPFLMTTDKKCLKAASSTVKSAIEDDLRGDVTLHVCEEIKKIATKYKFVIRSTLIKPLVAIELEDMTLPENESNSNKKRQNFSRTQKKSYKKNKKTNEEKDELNAKESLDTKCKYNSQILRNIFYIYFQVLKQRCISSKLLEVVLESFQKFGRLIDVKLFPETFIILTEICDNKKLSTENRLRGVFVALSIITSGKASDILEIDPIHFCQKLITIGEKENLSETSVLLIINCCTKILIKRRNQNTIGDVERIVKMLIHLAHNLKSTAHLSALLLISTVRYMRVYPKLQFMFDEEDDEMPEEFKQTVITKKNKQNSQKNVNQTLSVIQNLCNVIDYEVSGVAKRIKKFFMKSETENSLVGLKSSLEELTKLKTLECLEVLKARCIKAPKRKIEDTQKDEEPAKKAKIPMNT